MGFLNIYKQKKIGVPPYFAAKLKSTIVPEKTPSAGTYSRATTATVVDSEGVLRLARSGEARFQGARRVENIFTYSEDFSNAYWSKTRATVTQYLGSIPTGYTYAYKLIEDTATGPHHTSRGSLSFIAGNTYMITVVAKAAERTRVRLAIGNGVAITSQYTAFFDFTNQTWDNIGTSVLSTNTTSLGDGWYKLSVKAVAQVTATDSISAAMLVTTGSTTSYAGDGTSGVYITGAQFEDITCQLKQTPNEYVSTNVIRRNLLTRSEEMATSPNQSGIGGFFTATVDAIALPSGIITTAYKYVTSAATAGGLFLRQSALAVSLPVNTYTASIYIYVPTQAGVTNWGLVVDYSDVETVASSPGSFTTFDSWVRVSTASVILAAIRTAVDFNIRRNGLSPTNSDGFTFYAVGMQVNVGASALEYQRISTALPFDFANYQGAAVDGVKYFESTNGNYTSGNTLIIQDGEAINSAKSKFAYGCVSDGDYFSTPSSSNNNFSGDFSAIFECALTDWTPSAINILFAKDNTTAGTRSYSLNIQTTGKPRFNYSIDGTTLLGADCTVVTGIPDGTRAHIGVQRNSSTGDIKFYISTDYLMMNWTQLGTTVSGTSGTLYSSSSDLQFGNRTSLSYVLDGSIFDCELYSGLYWDNNATSVMKVDFDPSDWTSGTTWTSIETGEVWTLNGNAKIYSGKYNVDGPAGYLSESAATNLILRSEEFDNASWTKSATTVTANSSISPSCLTVADKLVDAAGTSQHFASQTITVTAQTYVFSVFAKASEYRYIQINMPDPGAGGAGKIGSFDLLTGSLGSVQDTGVTRAIEQFSNGWYRCSIKFTMTGSGTSAMALLIVGNTDTRARNYAGTAGSGIFIFGAQVEASLYATSYIPTTTATVTRNADYLAYTIADVGTMGTFKAETFINSISVGNFERFLEVSDGTTNNRCTLTHDANTKAYLRVMTSAVSQGTPGLSTASNYTSGFLRMSGSWMLDSLKFYVNSSLIETDTSATMPSGLTILSIGTGSSGGQANASVKNVKLYQKVLTSGL